MAESKSFNILDDSEWRAHQFRMMESQYEELKKIERSLGCLVAWFVILPIGLAILYFLFGITMF